MSRARGSGTVTTQRLLSSPSPDELDEAHPHPHASHAASPFPLTTTTTAAVATRTPPSSSSKRSAVASGSRSRITSTSARKLSNAQRRVQQQQQQEEEEEVEGESREASDPLRLGTEDPIFDAQSRRAQKQQQQQNRRLASPAQLQQARPMTPKQARAGPTSDKSSPPTPGRHMHPHASGSGSGSGSGSNEVQLVQPAPPAQAQAQAEGAEHEEEEEEGMAEQEGEDGNMPLLVFQCDTCGTVLGDSLAWVVARRDLGLLVLSAVTPAVHTQKENQTSSIPGPDLGSTYSVLSCQPCKSILGRAYKTTPRPLDELREAYALEVDAVRVYRLGSDLPPPRNEEAGEEREARAWEYAQEQRRNQQRGPPAAPQREESSVVPAGPSVEDHRVRVLLMGLGERLVRVERELQEVKGSVAPSSHAHAHANSSRQGILPPMAPPAPPRQQPYHQHQHQQQGSSADHAWSPPIDDAGEREAFRRHEQATSAKRLAADRMLAQFDHRGQPLAAKRARPRKPM